MGNRVMDQTARDQSAVNHILRLSQDTGINISGGRVRRTSSRFCLGVEHGDYNGTELFGVGTDRFIWLAYKSNHNEQVRLFSGNFPNDGIIEFKLGDVPPPKSTEISKTWARFPYGVEYVLRRHRIKLTKGIDAIIYSDIPGGGMSRSASLTLNLILSLLDVNAIEIEDPLKIVDLAQAVENDYIGSPCGQLDQIMILFAQKNKGVHYHPKNRTIKYVTLGEGADDFRLVVLDTGTQRPGLEKSTYKIRRRECEDLVKTLQKSGYDISCLADIKDQTLYDKIMDRFRKSHPDHCRRLKYIFHAQQRFYQMLNAWQNGDIETVGRTFRADGIGLRDDYQISGPELETMCDIARRLPGVLGERMLGGGDKGAAGALVRPESVEPLKKAVDTKYPHRHPEYAQKFKVHVCKTVDGVSIYHNWLK